MSKVVLVTGASSGVGKSLVKQLAAKGLQVIGCARNIQAIQELNTGENRITAIQCDITQEQQVLSMFDEINRTFGGLDVCVNNAGMALDSPLLNGKTDVWKAIMEVNVIGLCTITREAVKSMQQKGGDNCKIINVSSFLGIPSFKLKKPFLSFYAATKHAVTGITSALRGELIAAGLASRIQVMQINPGIIETEFFVRSSGEAVSDMILSKYQVLKPEDVGESIIHIINSPKHVTITDIVMLPTGAEQLQN